MPCTEAYKEHIEYTFNAFCRVVIHYAAINAWRDRDKRRQREISFEYLTEEKFYPFSTTDKYFLDPCKQYPVMICGQRVILTNGELAEALSSLPEKKREIIYLRKSGNYTDAAGVRRGITYTVPCKCCMKKWRCFSMRNGADIFPQGFAAVADHLRDFRGVNMLADIGNGTMNVMYINDRRPQEKKCFTEKYGTHQCMLAVRENLLKLYGSAADETIIDQVLRHGTASISERYLSAIQTTAREYVAGIFRRLREHEYDPELMKLYVVGGGGCLIKNFGEFDAGRVVINEDICTTAKGYEYLARLRARKGGTV